ncbi:MAG: glycosyl transferase, partial [Methylococcaceae bacterium]|nr:glycosyl transferase [Methylococcaceae bacterium]
VLAWLSEQADFASALIIRGIEGGILPTLREPSNCFQTFTGDAMECLIDPNEFGLQQTTRGVLPAEGTDVTAQQTVELGLAALSGKSGPAFDSLVLGGAMALWHCGLQATQQQAANHVRQVIKSGRANAFFEQGIG